MAMKPKKTGPTIAGPRPKYEPKYVVAPKAKKAAAAAKPVKITGTGSSSYDKVLVRGSMTTGPKFVEDRPRTNKKLSIKPPSKKINK